MKLSIKNSPLNESESTALVIAITADQTQSDVVMELDKLSNNAISALIQSGDISSEVGKTTFLYQLPTLANQGYKGKLLFVGCGEKTSFNKSSAKKVIKATINALLDKRVETASCDLLTLNPTICYYLARQFAEISAELTYRFDQFKTKKSPAITLNEIILTTTNSESVEEATRGLKQGEIIASAITATKDLANMPSNICNAEYLAKQGLALSKKYASLKANFYDEDELARLKMNAYLAVGRGSENQSIMTVLHYQGAADKAAKPYVLVGKGLTFDSGGISIKPAAGMDEMKYDMCGAATVYGVMQAVAELELPINVIGVMAGCENMPDGNAYRPGDILTTMSGTTVEVMNTDAEGRLVLCDALTFVERFNPNVVIDLATLTGACIVALGHHYTGVMGNDDALINDLILASKTAEDRAWSLPIDDDFQKQIDSTCADIMNASGRDGGTITAACFLSRFTKNYRWAHLDIAGTAWRSGNHKGATGRPISLLVQYLLDQSTEK